jgi:hypothetical protein
MDPSAGNGPCTAAICPGVGSFRSSNGRMRARQDSSEAIGNHDHHGQNGQRSSSHASVSRDAHAVALRWRWGRARGRRAERTVRWSPPHAGTRYATIGSRWQGLNPGLLEALRAGLEAALAWVEHLLGSDATVAEPASTLLGIACLSGMDPSLWSHPRCRIGRARRHRLRRRRL